MPVSDQIFGKSILNCLILACMPACYLFIALKTLWNCETIDWPADNFVYQTLFGKGVLSVLDKE